MTSEVQASDFDSLDFFDVIESNPDVSQSLHDAAFLAQTSKRCDMFDVKQKPINLDNDQSNQNNHIYSTIKILVNSKQKGNSILRHIKSIPYEFNSQIIADYVTGEKTCMLFLSLRYHCLNYNYIPDRMRQVTSSSKFALHILLVLVDTVNAGPLISQLGKLCVQANYTLLLSWSPEEAANYIETYQSLSKKSADTLRPKFIDSCGAKRAVECITSISGVNKTNGLSLITNFGSLSSIAAAKSSVIGLTHGIGDTKFMPRSDFSAYMRTSEPNIARGGVSAIISCEIELVDQSVKVIDVPRITLSEELYIQLCEHLPPFDSRLFGLRFKYPENFGGRVWLEPKKSLRKQGVMRGHVSFALSIRFFVPSVEYFQIKSDRDITLDMYFTELESMFISSQLRSSPSSVYQLAVCSLYARHGSTTSISIKHVHYLSSLKLDNTELLKHISKSSFSKNEAKMEFIKLCMQLPTYGLELHPVSCTSFGKCDIAVSIRGVSIMSGIEKLRDYPWNSIVKVLFKSRQFFIQLKRPKNETNNIGILCFECEKERACKILWRSCADYHTFFRNSVIIRNESADTNQADILKAINEERIPIVLSPQDGKYGFSFQFASNLMIISHVTPNGPAFGKLKRNDRIIQVNSEPLHKFSEESLKEYISKSGLNNSNLSLLPFQANLTRHSRLVSLYIFSSEFQSFETDMQQLEDDLLNQILAVRFLELERINPTLTTTVAKARYNLKKNRWRDILPYDHSRFVLPVASYMSSNDDYINANTVKVSIAQGPPSHYIASQGPLAETVEDFWRMVWASKTQMVVMLTGLVESGRPKCYQYWPEPGTILQAGAFHLETQNNQKNCNGFIMRRIKCSVRQRSRLITQLQYLDWPDHGCPENTEPFIKLLQMVHTHRLKNPEEPIVVHCSAGIGRTGVLILMETAVCLLKNRQTVRPLEIVANLRSQRPFMVQTPAQFLFCCELIVYLYRVGAYSDF